MHVNELNVRQLLELLSRRSGLNILVSPRVAGTITANFEGTPVDEVLQAVIKLANLVEKKEGTIHYLYTKDEMDDDAEITKREKILTRVYKLNYVRSDELLTMIRPFLSVEVGQKRVAVTPSYRFGIGESATFVSGGAGGASAGGGGASTSNTGGPTNQGASGGGSTVGGYQPPTGGNSMSDSDLLIVQDFESNLKIVDQIVQRIDRRPFQVLIEAVIISVDLEHARQLGVNFSLVDALGTALGTVGSGAALNSNVGFNPTQLLTTAGKIAGGAATDQPGFTSASNGAKFGFVANNVTGFIQALETIGSTKILASPRILVLNKQRAEIQLGQRLGFQTFSQNFTSTIQQVQFLNTGTLLRIRPFISEDGMIRMELHPERSSGTVVNNIPNQNTAELTTNVMVPDGATLVIGGLMEDEDDYAIQGLPGLSRMPALGFLFGYRQKTEGRRELVVLLTPHIWSADQAMAHGPLPINCVQPNQANIPGDVASNNNTQAAQAPHGSALTDPNLTESSISTAKPEIAVAAAATPTFASANAAAPTPTSGPVPAGTGGNQRAQDPQPPRRGFFRSFVDRMSHRSDSQNARRAKPSAARLDPEPGCDPAPGPKDQSLPAPDPALATPPGGSPAAVESAATQMPRRDAMVNQASWNVDSSHTAGSVAESLHREPDEPRPLPASQRSTRLSTGGMMAGPRRHSVENGETFASIAQLYYGSTRYERALWWANRGKFPRPGQLKAGDLLIVPAAEELEAVPGRDEITDSTHVAPRKTASEFVLPAASSGTPRSASRPASIARAEPSDRRSSTPRGASNGRRRNPPVHVVGPRETLRSIARDRLGDSHRADEIAELNQDRLLESGVLAPGQTLVLPFDAAVARPSR